MLANMAGAVYATPDDAVAAYLAGNDGPTAELRRFVLNNLRTLDDSRCTWRFDAAGLHTSFSRDMATEERQWVALSAIACPTLVMRGAESPALTMTTATRMARELQRGELVVIPDAGHDVHIDQFDAVIRELWRFFIER